MYVLYKYVHTYTANPIHVALDALYSPYLLVLCFVVSIKGQCFHKKHCAAWVDFCIWQSELAIQVDFKRLGIFKTKCFCIQQHVKYEWMELISYKGMQVGV